MRVIVHVVRGNGGALRTCPAMAEGVRVCGDEVVLLPDTAHKNADDYDAAIMWGYITTCQNIMKDYRAVGKPVVYMDMAYTHRHTHYKVAVNARHPTEYFQKIKHDNKRRRQFGLDPVPYHKNGQHILLAGMGAKSAWAENLEPVESWERSMVEELRKHTDRPIVYRSKPSWADAKPIPGTVFSPRTQPLQQVLNKNCHAVVTHHSNVAVDGLIEGIPAFAEIGIASPMVSKDFTQIERPYYPKGREQWLNDLAYCQWSIDEMRDGTVWNHLREEGLV